MAGHIIIIICKFVILEHCCRFQVLQQTSPQKKSLAFDEVQPVSPKKVAEDTQKKSPVKKSLFRQDVSRFDLKQQFFIFT
jgi:hypothetical protein